MQRLFILVILLYTALLNLSGQFYNGHQMQFGKNRVQYNDFYWTFYRFDKFDTYFNEYGQQLAQYTANFAEKEIHRLEIYFDYNLDKRIIFIIYNKLTDFRQSNIGLVTGKTENNIGGTIQIDRNKVFLFFEGDYKKFEQQITGAIAQVLINEMIYGLGFRDNATNSTLINLPDWYLKGLIAYVSTGWNFETENRVKDGILTRKFKRFNRLSGDDAAYAGHAFWRYITETYGESVIPSILYLTKINKNANSGFYYVLGTSIKDLSASCYQYYKELYSQEELKGTFPTDKPLIKRPGKKKVYQQMRISPTGNYIAYVTNQMGKYKIFLLETSTGKRKKIFVKEHKLEQITDYSYPTIAWHPSGRFLTFITEEQGGIRLYFYTLSEKALEWRNVLYFEKILTYSFSPDGSHLVMSAVKNGQSDIFVHNLAAGTNLQVTNDIEDDFSPRFINDGSMILFVSNRVLDTLKSESNLINAGYTQDLFIYDYKSQSPVLKRLADVQYINKSQPYEIGHNEYISLSDKNGIVNRYVSKFDSTISYVDTAIHYRYYAITEPSTNYNRNIIEQDYNPQTKKLGEILFHKGRYRMFSRDLSVPEAEISNPEPTQFRKEQTRNLASKDSLSKIVVIKIPLDSILNHEVIVGTDTISVETEKIDINNYIFEIERIKMLNQEFKDRKINITVVANDDSQPPQARIYQKSFYQDYLVTQIDFSFLNESYQPFTGGAVYYNPGTNLLFKIGTHDLFEDYKLTGGIRIPLDLQSTEYLISLENLKKRVDKQFVYHRQTFNNTTSDENPFEVRNISQQFSGVFRYPLSQINSFVGTVSFRNDKLIYLPALTPTTALTALSKKNVERLWLNTKGEYIFDNTRSLGLNLPAGTRFKIFAEAYQQINDNHYNLFVFGADFRNYLVIHRNLIWANRFAMSASTGSARLIYYLGGVDNWTNFSARTPTFIPLSEIRLTPGVNYAFQTLATNMRGFSQNIRNGSNFALINSEIRWPIVRYIANYPLSNAFLENFQVMGFFDIGSAWSGLSPWSKKNGYDRDFVSRGLVEIEIDANRSPFVAGYGFGVRSQLLGYFIRLDWAWGIENMQVLPRVFYLSLALDF